MQVSFDTSASGKAPTPQRMKLNLRSFKTKSHSAGTSFPALLIIKEISSRVRCPATRLGATQQAQEFQELLRQRNVTTHPPTRLAFAIASNARQECEKRSLPARVSEVFGLLPKPRTTASCAPNTSRNVIT